MRALAEAGYSDTPLAQKLGYKDGQRILFVALPQSLGGLRTARRFAETAELEWRELASGRSGYDVIHGFTAVRAELAVAAEVLRRQIGRDGMVWISWPKRSSGVASEIGDGVIRELLLPTGLVDVKVAAIDQVWSGLKLVIRKELR